MRECRVTALQASRSTVDARALLIEFAQFTRKEAQACLLDRKSVV